MTRRWLAVVVIAVGCVVAVAAEARVAVRDMAGRDVSLGAMPRRIVSLVPSATEIIFALGGQDRLVGVTDYCDFPPAARRKPSVGGMVDPSLERIVALQPDLVLATREGNSEATFDQVTRLGIPIYLVIAHRVADVTDVIRRLAELTERDSAAPSLIARLDGRIAGIREAVAPLRRPRVLYVVWPEPLIVPGRDALVTELIELAGGESITGGEAHAYPRFSVEAAVAKAPEIVVVANHGSGSGPVALEPWARLTSLIKARRVQSVDGNLLHRYGPRVVDGLEELARVIHPEVVR